MSLIWDSILTKLEEKHGTDAITEWLRPTRVIEENENRLQVLVPNPLFIEWIQENYLDDIQHVLEEWGKPHIPVQLVSEDEVTVQRAPQVDEPVRVTPVHNPNEVAETLKLNPKYFFDSFVVGKSNQLCHAASRAVAEAPSTTYNPLYIYGDSGLGKTHLLHAVAHHLIQDRPSLKLCYTTCEEFTNQFINSIRYNRGEAFRERYRNVDVLLIDDIQFLSGKQQTQEEFFHTFNALFEQQKQIILSSDCAPSEIQKLESRLTSRFQWGLIADIQPPELETRIAILRKKAETDGIRLSDHVLLYIASRVKSNVRELEGVLVKLVAYASLGGREIDQQLAEQCLAGIGAERSLEVNCERIQKLVADYFKIHTKELISRSNTKKIARPRQIAMYLTRQMTNMSLPEIGAAFGNKHHSTVLYSVNKIEKLVENSPEERELIQSLRKSLT